MEGSKVKHEENKSNFEKKYIIKAGVYRGKSRRNRRF